jgi:hypothetical protein
MPATVAPSALPRRRTSAISSFDAWADTMNATVPGPVAARSRSWHPTAAIAVGQSAGANCSPPRISTSSIRPSLWS